MTPDYRAMCAELLCSLENYPVQPSRDRDLCDRARALLAEPEPEGPTDQELLRCGKIATPCYNLKLWERELNMMRAAIAADRARWGRPTPQPVPVSERLPKPEDCDAEGRFWAGRSESEDWSADWTLATPEAVAVFCEFSPQTVWLPAHALPTPEAPNE